MRQHAGRTILGDLKERAAIDAKGRNNERHPAIDFVVDHVGMYVDKSRTQLGDHRLKSEFLFNTRVRRTVLEKDDSNRNAEIDRNRTVTVRSLHLPVSIEPFQHRANTSSGHRNA